jgi:hypothetical protein
MPVMRCSEESRPGFRWGSEGKCYTYAPGDPASRERARRQAERQGRAVEASQARSPGPSGHELGRDATLSDSLYHDFK